MFKASFDHTSSLFGKKRIFGEGQSGMHRTIRKCNAGKLNATFQQNVLTFSGNRAQKKTFFSSLTDLVCSPYGLHKQAGVQILKMLSKSPVFCHKRNSALVKITPRASDEECMRERGRKKEN